MPAMAPTAPEPEKTTLTDTDAREPDTTPNTEAESSPAPDDETFRPDPAPDPTVPIRRRTGRRKRPAPPVDESAPDLQADAPIAAVSDANPAPPAAATADPPEPSGETTAREENLIESSPNPLASAAPAESSAPGTPEEPVTRAPPPETPAEAEVRRLRRQVLALGEERENLASQLEQTRRALAEMDSRFESLERAGRQREHELQQKLAALQRQHEKLLALAGTTAPPVTGAGGPTPSGHGMSQPETTGHALFPYEPESLASRLPFVKIVGAVLFLAVIALLGIFLVDTLSQFLPPQRRAEDRALEDRLAQMRTAEPKPEPPPLLTPHEEAAFPAAPRPAPDPTATPFRAPPPAPWPKLPGLRGVRVATNDTDVSLVFEEGLFERWAELSPSGRTRLQAVGRVLRGRLDGFQVLIEGHADPGAMGAGCPYPSNDALALVRARTAAGVLREAADLAEHQVRTVSMGDRANPYPNTARELRERNRTVVIKILRVSRPEPAAP
jgi:flagellar motor protein MotB